MSQGSGRGLQQLPFRAHSLLLAGWGTPQNPLLFHAPQGLALAPPVPGQPHLDPSSGLSPAPPGHTTLLWWTSGLMVSWTTNHVALRRMKAEMRFQWMMFLRHRMLLEAGECG